MANTTNKVVLQALQDYLNDVKPYHTKLRELEADYIFSDQMDVVFLEDDIFTRINLQNVWGKDHAGGWRMFGTSDGSTKQWRIPPVVIPRFSLNTIAGQTPIGDDPATPGVLGGGGIGVPPGEVPWFGVADPASWKNHVSHSHQRGSDRVPYSLQVKRIEVTPVLSTTTNYTQHSETFDDAYWVGVVAKNVVADTTIAPDGNKTADTLSDNSAGAFQGITHDWYIRTNDSLTRTFSIHVKKTTGGTSATFGLNFGLTGGGTPITQTQARYNTDTGAVSGTGSPTAVSVGNYWRFSISITNNSTNHTVASVGIYAATAAYGSFADVATAIGSAIIWGAQLNIGSAPTTYLPTTTFKADYFRVFGGGGGGANTADSVALSITGDLDIRTAVALDDWTPAVAGVIVSKDNEVAGQRSWYVGVNSTGNLIIGISHDGTAITAATSSTPTIFANGTLGRVRYTFESATGNIKFYTSTDGIVWTQLGTTQTVTAGSIFDSATNVFIGSYGDGAFPILGNVYNLQIYNGINGSLAADFKPSLGIEDEISFVSATGETWAINPANSKLVGTPATRTSSFIPRDANKKTWRQNVTIKYVYDTDFAVNVLGYSVVAPAFYDFAGNVVVAGYTWDALLKTLTITSFVDVDLDYEGWNTTPWNSTEWGSDLSVNLITNDTIVNGVSMTVDASQFPEAGYLFNNAELINDQTPLQLQLLPFVKELLYRREFIHATIADSGAYKVNHHSGSYVTVNGVAKMFGDDYIVNDARDEIIFLSGKRPLPNDELRFNLFTVDRLLLSVNSPFEADVATTYDENRYDIPLYDSLTASTVFESDEFILIVGDLLPQRYSVTFDTVTEGLVKGDMFDIVIDPAAPEETWTIRALSQYLFSVTGSISGQLPNISPLGGTTDYKALYGRRFDNGKIAFTIKNTFQAYYMTPDMDDYASIDLSLFDVFLYNGARDYTDFLPNLGIQTEHGVITDPNPPLHNPVELTPFGKIKLVAETNNAITPPKSQQYYVFEFNEPPARGTLVELRAEQNDQFNTMVSVDIDENIRLLERYIPSEFIDLVNAGYDIPAFDVKTIDGYNRLADGSLITGDNDDSKTGVVDDLYYRLKSSAGTPTFIHDFITGENLNPVLGGGTTTFTRTGATATRVNPNGFIEGVAANTARFDYDPTNRVQRGLLIESPRINSLLQSNGFTTTWTVLATPTLTQNQAGPDGVANSAWTILDNDAGNFEGISQPITVPNNSVSYTFSIFVLKTIAPVYAGSLTNWNPSDKDADVTLSNGNLTFSAALSGSVRSTLSYPTGSVYAEFLITTAGAACVGVANVSADLTGRFSSDNNGLSYDASGQIAKNGFVITTVAGYVDGDVVEILYNATNSTVAFYKNGSLVYLASGSDIPAGTLYFAGGIYAPAATTVVANFGSTSFAYVPGTSPTFGLNFALTGGTPVTGNLRVNTDTGAILAGNLFTSEDYGRYWRVSTTIANNSSGNTTLACQIYPATAQYGSNADVATATGSAVIYGAQAEQTVTGQPRPSSYIPTTVATSTRAAEGAIDTLGAWFSATEGTMVAEFMPLDTTSNNAAIYSIDNVTTSERTLAYTGGAGSAIFLVIDGGVTQASLTAGAITQKAISRIAGAYKLNSFAASVAGATALTSFSGTLPTPTQLVLGDVAIPGTSPLNGWIRKLWYWPTRLTDLQLKSLSKSGLELVGPWYVHNAYLGSNNYYNQGSWIEGGGITIFGVNELTLHHTLTLPFQITVKVGGVVVEPNNIILDAARITIQFNTITMFEVFIVDSTPEDIIGEFTVGAFTVG